MDTEVRGRQEDEIRLKDLIQTLKAYRVRAMLFVLICTGIVAAFAFLLPRKYDAMIMVSPISSTASRRA